MSKQNNTAEITDYSARKATVLSIGKGTRYAEEASASIVATLPEGFDPKARGAVAEAVHNWAVGEGNERPALTRGPKGAQTRTDYGRGVDALVSAVKRALKDDGPKPIVLRATLSGEGGGSVTIDPETDAALYKVLVARIQGEDAVENAA